MEKECLFCQKLGFICETIGKEGEVKARLLRFNDGEKNLAWNTIESCSIRARVLREKNERSKKL